MRHKLRKNRKLDNNIPLREVVFYYLAKNWSPEQIAKRLIVLYPNDMIMRVSHETIYSYLYILPRGALKREIVSSLRRHHLHRRKKNKDRQKLGSIQDFLSIEERPKEVADRIIPGHWEGDLIIGRRNASAIGTLVERTTRMTFLVKIGNQEARTVRKAFAEEFRQLPKGLKRTLTYDQGREMAQHKLFSKDTDITVYFAHPSSPWERGTNENTNGLIRQYFPSGTDFNKISINRLKEVQDELNDRPRKTLGFYTPHEKFCEVLR
jgi:IS30 family transposase